MTENITTAETAIYNQEEKLGLGEGLLRAHVLNYIENLFNSIEVVRAYSNKNRKIIDLANTKAVKLETISENKMKSLVINGFKSLDVDRYFTLTNDIMRVQLERNLSNIKGLEEGFIEETLDICSVYLKESFDWFIKGKIIARKSNTYNYNSKKKES